ncbi:hypothetical protein GCM10023205_43730 [Yinghuangia aomiensis]|uniref:Uncharacterized protein n=1 Tax=Yinghuangia aomiensis TaxID=676205 RepID=A0ABP9HKK3_9ACTN
MTTHAISPAHHMRRTRIWLAVFLAGLVVSGLTAFPLETETAWLADLAHRTSWLPTDVVAWIDRTREGVAVTNAHYPFLAYGTDWLAFAHLTIAAAFWGPLCDPVRNVWVVQWGLIACAALVPLALVCGPVRGIPVYWSLIDMSFGFFGAIPLLFALHHIRALERAAGAPAQQGPATPPAANRLTESIN